MFDLRSPHPPPKNTKGLDCEEGFVNSNVVLQKALQQLTSEERANIVLRCDDLPFVQGTEEEYEVAFAHLLKMILKKREEVATLFLHIHCTIEKTETQRAARLKWFSIQFNSNISSGAGWLQAHSDRIAEIAAILRKNGGKLLVNQVKSSGCIFSVSVPGKTF